MPEIWHAGTVTSVLDVARDPSLAAGQWRGRMPGPLAPFDSIIAEAQTAGRGQFRRHWSSPAGNIYAALRLPSGPPFAGTEAAVALGAWMVGGLRLEGYPALLKWPNDVAVLEAGLPRKVCGILLEERAGVLLAGIGVNVAHSPADGELRPDAAMPAGNLAACAARLGLPAPSAQSLWQSLVKHVHSFYSRYAEPASGWLEAANARLLWRGRHVELEDSGSTMVGRLRGIGARGELVLETPAGEKSFLSGSIRCCDHDCR